MANFFKNIFIKNKKLSTDELIVKKTIISFFFFFILMGAGFWGWKWLRHQPETANGTRQPLRNVLAMNESLFRKILSNRHLTKEYSEEDAVKKTFIIILAYFNTELRT